MLKRNVGVVIAGMLLGAHFGMAVAGDDAFPASARTNREQSEPSPRTTYQEQHAGSMFPLVN